MNRASLLAFSFVLFGCGGQVEDADAKREGDGPGSTTTKADPLEKLRARCAEPWKNNFNSDVKPSRSLAAGRWLRCPGDSAQSGRPYIATFDAIELTADKQFFRLATGPNGFERSTGQLGDTGKWDLHPDDKLVFELPPCSEGYVTSGKVTSCGGLDVATPLFEASPTRMRFYGAASWYVKDE